MTENINRSNVHHTNTGMQGTKQQGVDNWNQPLKPTQDNFGMQTNQPIDSSHANNQTSWGSTQQQGQAWQQDSKFGESHSHQKHDHHLEKSILPEQTFKGKAVEAWDRMTGKSELDIQARQIFIKLNDAADQAYDSAKSKATDFVMKIMDKKNKLEAKINSNNPEEARKAREALDEATQHMTQIFEILRDKATEAADVIAQMAAAAFDKMGDSEMANELKQHAGEAFDLVKSKTAEAADEIQRQTQNQSNLEDKAGVALNVAANKISETGQELKNSRAAQELKDKGGKAVSVAAGKASEAASEMKQQYDNSSGVGEAAGKAYDIAKQKASEGVDELHRQVGSSSTVGSGSNSGMRQQPSSGSSSQYSNYK